MKILILYATKWGVSAECAEMLTEPLKEKNDITLCNIAEKAPAPHSYDVIVLGGSIRMGQLNKRLKQYLKQYRPTLEQKPCAFYFCCGFADNLEDYIETQLPKGMDFSLGIHCFGGELKPEKMKGFDKWIIRRVRSAMRQKDFEENGDTVDPPEIIPENIARLTDAIRATAKI